jgi:two-component system chemotaxis response regulator CheY
MERILLVDDDATHRMNLRFLLEEEGFLCLEAEDGEEALEKLASGCFSLVITDLNMPRVNGLDLLVAMEKNNILETTPVIVTTGEAKEGLRKHILGFGAATVFFKPYRPMDLVSIVAKTIKGAALQR